MKTIEEQWYELTLKSVEKLTSAQGNWNQLSSGDQELAALWKLQSDISNGGFTQFICNWGLDGYNFAKRALQNIQADQARQIIEVQFTIIESTIERHQDNIDDLWDIPGYLSKEDSNHIDALDQQFWRCSNSLSRSGLRFYAN